MAGYPSVVSGATEVSIGGKWVEVPAVRIGGQTILLRGRWMKIASLQDEDWIEEELADPAACIRLLKAGPRAERPDVLRFSQRVPDVALRHPYPVDLRSIAVARVDVFDRWWESLPQETRKNVRRSKKRGVSIEVRSFDDEVIQGIAGIQNETPFRQGRAYPHYGKSLEQVRRDHGAFLDRSDFICARFEGEIIGVLKLVYRGGIASILQLNSKAAHYDKRPSNALLARAVELCAEKGKSHLTYGLYNYGRKKTSPLREFKERHGFEEMLLPCYYVPLTPRGWIYVRSQLYRGLLGILPENVINAGLSLRSRWYNSFTPRRCSSMPEQPNCNRQMGR